MTGLLDMPLEEWLKARVKEIEISRLLPELTAPTSSANEQLRYQTDNGDFEDYLYPETGSL